MTKRRDWLAAARWALAWAAMGVGVVLLASPLGGFVLCGAVLFGIGATVLLAPAFSADAS